MQLHIAGTTMIAEFLSCSYKMVIIYAQCPCSHSKVIIYAQCPCSHSKVIIHAQCPCSYTSQEQQW